MSFWEYRRHTNKRCELGQASVVGVAIGPWKQSSSFQHTRRKPVPPKNASTPSRSVENTDQYSDFGLMSFLAYRRHTNKRCELGQASVVGVAMVPWKQSSSFQHTRRKPVPPKKASTTPRSVENTDQYSDFGLMSFFAYRRHTYKRCELGQASVVGVAMGPWKQSSSFQHTRRKPVPPKNASTPSRSGENTARYSDSGVVYFLEYIKPTHK